MFGKDWHISADKIVFWLEQVVTKSLDLRLFQVFEGVD
jgi:hypothetical protein